MTLKELSQLYYLNREISDLKLKIAEIEAKATGTSVKITGMPHAPASHDIIGRLVADLDYYKSVLSSRLEQYRSEFERLNNYISGCDDSLTRQILTYRFINGLPWTQVAASIGGSTSEYAVKKAAYRYIKQH